jgi:hypothetical protein
MQRHRHADDDIWRVHSRYLGPKGSTLPFSIPYRGVIPFVAVFALTVVVLSMFGVGLWRFVIAGVLGAGALKLADYYGGAERPVSSLPAILSHESGAPRPQQQAPISVVLRPGRVPVHDPGPTRTNGGQQ